MQEVEVHRRLPRSIGRAKAMVLRYEFWCVNTFAECLHGSGDLYERSELSLSLDFADKSIASCSVPQCPISPNIEKELIHNAYNAGSIVWAHLHGFPWWPGIVTDCPDTLAYYQLRKKSLKPVSVTDGLLV